jgi:predicted ATP-grasp superfamily ATP-dependent carboligase
VEACAGRLPPVGSVRHLANPARAAGKAVLYATENLQVPDTRDWPARGIRDVPHAGERIAAGRPICTLVAIGRSPELVLDDLEARAAALRHELHVRGGVDAVA